MSEVRALIVDDSTVMRKIVERSLRQAGWNHSSLRRRAAEPKGSISFEPGDST